MAKALIQKNWYEVQAPDIFSVDTVAETPAEKSSQVVGRTVKAGLDELMDGASKYYVDVKLQVTEVEGNKAFSEIQGMSCSSEFVSRMVRKRSDRFDMVHDTETQDGRTVRVKLVGATLRKTSGETLRSVRNELSELIDERASEQAYEEFMENIFMDELQKEMRDLTNEIYPFRELEVRKTEL
ncbi:MAG: hypothetical protein ABEJ69_03385, partial [Candidatus Nanohaloarchaea archaeon]